ncbi:GNAT family N-acetyltransferase [Clostridium oryzae]|uniref:Putative ribosomal N-acetyltransferase YdaF n=1 Tax=Clostridium oryzae TaxID=1450648 RepID=A0A1V4IVU3_9CLOT|nr:GNAT family protein [Clostridium oryzae]OPJ63950.1 putative ribosomal N-acetyltransferase YdaF [Clostridium oryzae]
MARSPIENYMLVPLQESYFKELYSWNTEEEHFELYTCRPVTKQKNYEEYIKVMQKSINNKSEKTYLLIDECYPDLPLGRVKVFDYNPRNHSAEFGYYFPRINRNQGLGSIMLKNFLYIVFQDTELNLNKLYATTCSNNSPSIKLLEKHGFKLDGRLREHYWIDAIKYDQCVYSILKGELI